LENPTSRLVIQRQWASTCMVTALGGCSLRGLAEDGQRPGGPLEVNRTLWEGLVRADDEQSARHKPLHEECKHLTL